MKKKQDDGLWNNEITEAIVSLRKEVEFLQKRMKIMVAIMDQQSKILEHLTDRVLGPK